MNACIEELKTRARIGLNAVRAGDRSIVARAASVSGRKPFEPEDWQLRHALALVAQGVGFHHWDHARTVLAGEARPGDDMGRLWHAPGTVTLLNHWYAHYAEATAYHRSAPASALLPYGRQFVVVGADYLREIGVSERIQDAPAQGFDAVAEYGSPRWLAWCEARIRAPLPTWMR
jgi:hypothetical protein